MQDYLSNNKGDFYELERKVTKIYHKSSPYYNKLSRTSKLSMIFDKVNVYMEGIKILNVNNFKVIQEETKIYDKFDIDHLNSYSLTYKNHTIFYKEVKSHKVKNTFAEIYCNDMKLSFIDVKLLDKISFFSIILSKKLLSYPFGENVLKELVDESPMENKNTVYLYVENLEAVVNSLDPKTGELYNKLYLRINYVALSNEKDKNNEKTELTVYYFSFGFNIDIYNLDSKNKTRDYPLIILPLLELNIDGNVYRFNIPRNYMSKKNKNDYKKMDKLRKISINTVNEKNIYFEENKNSTKNRGLVNNYVGDNKLDNFILNTQSLTIFINYHYLKVFTKIFENLWNRSEFIQQYLIHKKKNNNNINANLNTNEKISDISILDTDYKRRKDKIHSYLEKKRINLFNKNKKEDIDKDKEKEKNRKDNNEKELIKMISTIFDLKIIYLINYQDKYYSTFLYHPKIKKHGYFGFIIRLYSSICKYSNHNVDDIDYITHGILETQSNLLTITSLNENNLNDEKYFIYDKDILDLNCYNYKDNKIFNTFMEVPESKSNKYKAINSILFNKNGEKIFQFLDNDLPINNEFYKELPFKFNETLIKMHDIKVDQHNVNDKELQKVNISLDDMKVTWNKINMDTVGILIYEEILPITNAILHKLSNDEDNNANKKNNNLNINENNNKYAIIRKQTSTNSFINKKEDKLEESEFSMNFIINNFQICIENEITNSKLLIATRDKIILEIKKVCFNENEKIFNMKLTIKNFIFYIPPTLSSNDAHIICWIVNPENPENNKYYLSEEEFSQIATLLKVSLKIEEIIKNDDIKPLPNEDDNDLKDFHNNIINISRDNENEEDENNIKSTSTVDITIDRFNGEFKKEDFNCFMNIIKVFIFNRGDSYAEEKMALDGKVKDLKKYKLMEIKNKIEENLINKNNLIKKPIKEIRFILKDVSMTLLSNEKEYIKLLMNNLKGTQTKNEDLSSEVIINIQNWYILDLQNPNNEILLSQQSNTISQKIKKNADNNYYENKLEMLRFILKDNNISIGTDSKWYVIQYLEIGILPLYLNITKNQCDFILEFFFNTNSSNSNLSYDDYKKLIDNFQMMKKKIIKI